MFSKAPWRIGGTLTFLVFLAFAQSTNQMLLAQLPDKRIVHPIFYLPTELIAMMAKHLSDGDLYNLTRVSYHMASIACPIFLRRKDLTFSSHMNTVSLHGEAFKAFDVWLRSPEFSAGKRLLCSFSRDMTYAALQMKYLYRCFNEFPLQPRTFFRHVRLTDVETRNVGDLLQLLALTVFRTGCPDVTMTHVTYQEAPRRTRKSVMAGKCVVVLESLQRLKLSYFQLSLLQWGDFLSKLYIPSLHFFEVVGPTSMVAIYEFLLRHSDIHRLYFIMCVWTDIPSLSRLLDLPNLRSLRGYSYQVKFVLSSLRSPPDLHELVIDSDPAAKWQSGGFIDEFVDCLSMCEGSVTVEISLSRESVSELTSTAARAFAARKLHSTRLPTVISLRIGFSDMDEVFPVCLSYPGFGSC